MIYTAKKASWLNMAEIELSALSKQCLDRRISDRHILTEEILAWGQAMQLPGHHGNPVVYKERCSRESWQLLLE